MTYVTINQVRAAFDETQFVQLFAEQGEFAVANGNPALILVMQEAHAQTTSEITPIYGDRTMPTEVDPNNPTPVTFAPGTVAFYLVAAEIAYIRVLAYERKPAIAYAISPTYLKDLGDKAQKAMDRLKSAIVEIAPNDNPPPEKPANVGGITTDQSPRMLSDVHTGRSNFGDF